MSGPMFRSEQFHLPTRPRRGPGWSSSRATKALAFAACVGGSVSVACCVAVRTTRLPVLSAGNALGSTLSDTGCVTSAGSILVVERASRVGSVVRASTATARSSPVVSPVAAPFAFHLTLPVIVACPPSRSSLPLTITRGGPSGPA
jgi:hypothetical protein